MKKQTLKLNKVRISKINNLNTILGGGDGGYEEATRADYHTCEPIRCTITGTTNTDTTDGEVTGIDNGGRTTTN